MESVQVVLSNLEKRGYSTYLVDTKEELYQVLDMLIEDNSTIGFGGSQTVEELNVHEYLHEKGHDVLHYKINKTYDYPTLTKMSRDADYYICSTNALTVGGELVNIDGTANRIASMVYGPTNVIIIAGTNKITANLDDAISRCRNVAAPKNCVRLNRDTPCAKTGRCSNCSSSQNICRATLIQHYPTKNKNVTIILINGEYGY